MRLPWVTTMSLAILAGLSCDLSAMLMIALEVVATLSRPADQLPHQLQLFISGHFTRV